MGISTHGEPATLLVASTGGHLEQLYRLRDRLVPTSGDVVWVTFDDPQSRSMLAGEQVHYVRYVPPRGYRAAASNVRSAHRILRNHAFDRVVSTGSGVALPFLSIARAHRISCHYIESATRAEGPSLTGSLLSRVPGLHLYTQHESWASGRWQYRGSLFDGYEGADLEDAPDKAHRVVITLGTMRTYGFRRAVEALLRVLPEVTSSDAEILWQIGSTDVSGLPIQARESIPSAEMRAAILNADLVIAHAGIGSALTALGSGRCPVLLPRLGARGEHIDDHQRAIAEALDRRGLAVSRDPDDLTAVDLRRAMARTVTVPDGPRPFRLVG